MIGEVAGRNALIVDDEVDTAATLIATAEMVLRNGAKEVYAAATHPILSGPAVERLAASPIREIVVTDSIPLNDKAHTLGDRIKVLSVSGLLAEAIRRIHTNRSVSSLFGQ